MAQDRPVLCRAVAADRGQGGHPYAGRRRSPATGGSATATARSVPVRFALARPQSPHRWRPRAASATVPGRLSYRFGRALTTVTAVATLAAGGGATSTAQAAGPTPYSAHSMVYTCCTPYRLKERMFFEAKSMRSAYIRLDVEIAAIFEVYGGWRASPDWSKLDEVLALSRRYRLPVVGVLRMTPAPLSSCPAAPDPGKCAPTDYGRYGSLAAQIAAHARGVIRHWEVVNEPDKRWAFLGTASQYAWMLRATYDAIKAAAPEDQLLLGGVTTREASRDWLARVFGTPGAGAAHRFDVANVHLRGDLDTLSATMATVRALFARHAFRGPLWVTEHGYPGDTRHQRDPHFHGGERAQARYLQQSLPSLLRAGAKQVFLTLRDGTTTEFGDSPYTSEGVLSYASYEPYPVRRKPSFWLVRRLARLSPANAATTHKSPAPDPTDATRSTAGR